MLKAKLLSGHHLPIALDDESTWPNATLNLLSSGLEAMRVYEDLRQQRDQMGTFEAIQAGENPFLQDRNCIISSIHESVLDHSLFGYHCTRLTRREIAEIQDNGLLVLSPELLDRRITQIQQQDLISVSHASVLKEHNSSNESFRCGQIWFVFSPSLLVEELGVGNLFRYWGGEALYGLYAEHTEIGPLLRSVGEACIVEAAVPVQQIETFMSVGERMAAAYLGRRGVETQVGSGMQGFILEQLAVRRVIRRTEEDFERLTRCRDWDLAL